MFEEIAGHLVAEGLGALEDHGWLERAVQHALVETSGPELLVKTQRGSLSSQTWWPASQFVNYMQLHITHPSGTHEVEMRRGDASEQENENFESITEVQLNSTSTSNNLTKRKYCLASRAVDRIL